MARAPKRRGERLPLPPTPPQEISDERDYVYVSPQEQQKTQPYYSQPLMTPETRRYRVGGRQMMDPGNSDMARYLEEMKSMPRRLKTGGPVKKYEGGGMVEIEIKVGGKGKHKMPDGTMMDDDEMESEEYKKGGRVKKMAKGGATGNKKFIQNAIKKPGALRAQLGAKAGQKIPAKKLAAAAKAPGKLGQRARFAQTLSKMKKK